MSASSSAWDYRSLLPSSLDRSTFSTQGEQDSIDAAAAEEQEELTCPCCPDGLGWRERLLGCATCMICGYLLSLGSFWRLMDLSQGNPYPFVLNATVGNIIALGGSFFLSGPKAQWRRMWHDSRRTATLLYLGSLVLTLFVALVDIPGPQALYLVIFMLAQYVAITWYCLSYIPFAQDMITNYVRRRWNTSSSSGLAGDDF